MPHPVKLKKLMTTCAERQEIVVDFAGYQPGDTVTLYSDDSPLVEFRIHEFTPAGEELPTTLTKIDYPTPDPSLPVKQVVMSGMDETVMIDGKKFQMDRIDYTMPMGKCQLWDITNTNDMNGGMIHPSTCTAAPLRSSPVTARNPTRLNTDLTTPSPLTRANTSSSRSTSKCRGSLCTIVTLSNTKMAG